MLCTSSGKRVNIIRNITKPKPTRKKRQLPQYTDGVPVPIRPAPTSKSGIARENKIIQLLKADSWITGVHPTNVRCRGCDKEIQLDRRRRYYGSLWNKHKARCPDLEKLQSAYTALRALGNKGRATDAGLPLVATSPSPILSKPKPASSSQRQGIKNRQRRSAGRS